MKIIDDPIIRKWLQSLDPEPDDFDWDEGNKDKNLKHDVTQNEIESIFQNEYGFAGRIVEPIHAEWRGLILGRSHTGKLLALIFTCREERLRPISCRPMRKWEVKKYHESTKT